MCCWSAAAVHKWACRRATHRSLTYAVAQCVGAAVFVTSLSLLLQALGNRD